MNANLFGATLNQTIPWFMSDDLDNDLIIDTDIDIDNDGISNCDESLGNVVLDVTDVNQPVLNFLDGSMITHMSPPPIVSLI